MCTFFPFFLSTVESATIPVQFNDHNKVYHLLWTELLQCGSELPFASYEDIVVGSDVLAPWQYGDKVQYSVATVVEESSTGICRCLPNHVYNKLHNLFFKSSNVASLFVVVY